MYVCMYVCMIGGGCICIFNYVYVDIYEMKNVTNLLEVIVGLNILKIQNTKNSWIDKLKPKPFETSKMIKDLKGN